MTSPQPDEIERVKVALLEAAEAEPRIFIQESEAEILATAAIAAMDTSLREQIAAKDEALKQVRTEAARGPIAGPVRLARIHGIVRAAPTKPEGGK